MAQGTPALRYETLCVRRPGLTRDVPPGKEDLEWVANTATLIHGQRDAVLVDTFLTIDQNQQLVDWIKAHDRNLTYIYITHGHGDHFFGIKQLLEAFPGAKPVSSPGTARRAGREGAPEFLEGFWNSQFPGQIAQPQIFPEPLDGETFTLEGHALQVIETGHTDTDHSTALWVPSLRLVVAGDVGYNGIHQYMGEADTAIRQKWARAAEELAALDPLYVVAGHKRPELPDDPRSLAETSRYLTDFNRLEAQTSTAHELYESMLELYPDRANPGSLWGGAKRAKPPTKL
ncbi:Zn-dependent hydrolase, glyoxylase [Mycobacteroides abscessus subsp. massiliense]|uniref:MBL fold metallo-hydrolase n=1 Tax=Mycobacteroides abscessus TaxID=36809 RepID=UPI0009C5422B|nr:MBL fold metallo-hydrolase [Mycobacteroides abscessus]SKH58559.1 Zn-dependent hydrolase, glyoxylase [Mycobacteroides abscessus subsp. massiliense]SKH92753.1 Zn-dependent hydrolase, glyoxylase [Mycobacteroides abscessus subsp. massiliense]SKI13210.1 Zn-dependent hydrolase, glyoxylase [Mycobacteroides abscessus subsp. massiliense]SKJ98784.1 Zn-dependent hydrolase, glyoxylase [Mycobacteroides abscessus subsp. massiliense]SKK28685.1 Zn-dependent hydrolase, glyoxylase [Mycobacteroides abscessus 